MKIKIYEALGNFQQECPTIKKSKKGYGYKYADLHRIVETIKPYMKKHQLGFSQALTGENGLKTMIFHMESGERIEETVLMPSGNVLKGMNLFQTDGARNTYYKRYALLGMLGVVTEDEDIDARGQFKNKVSTATNKKPKLDDAKLQKAIAGIKTSKYTVDELVATWDISKEQLEALNNAII